MTFVVHVLPKFGGKTVQDIGKQYLRINSSLNFQRDQLPYICLKPETKIALPSLYSRIRE